MPTQSGFLVSQAYNDSTREEVVYNPINVNFDINAGLADRWNEFVSFVAKLWATIISFIQRQAGHIRLRNIFRKKEGIPLLVDLRMGSPDQAWMFFDVTHEVTTHRILTFEGRGSQPLKQTALVRDLFKIRGVSEVALMPYLVRVTRAHLFPASDLKPQIERAIRKHLK